jgi:hypothetical protein
MAERETEGSRLFQAFLKTSMFSTEHVEHRIADGEKKNGRPWLAARF